MAQVRHTRLLIDLNVLLDSLLAREPWDATARAIWQAHDQRLVTCLVAAHALTNLFSIARRLIGTTPARSAVRLCLQTFPIVPVGRAELEQADRFVGPDIEDNLVLACAMHANLDAIVTRDPSGFLDSPLPVLTPAEIFAELMINPT